MMPSSMVQKLESLRGMDDILPGEVEKWQWLEEQARIFFEAWNFEEIRTPIAEPTELFTRSIGETTDIVHKEMYTFMDRGERSMTLRPEMTASVARSVIQHGLLKTAPYLRLYYMGPMFRAERPQAGRKRQFHQIGVEIINLGGSEWDLYAIRALTHFLKFLKIDEPKLRVNDLTRISGSEAQKIRVQLKDYFEKHKNKLDKDSLYRLDKNVLRIFDSKDPQTQSVLDQVPWEDIAPLSDDFKHFTNRLKEYGISYELNRRLVRGLDYYTGIVFEVALPGLGAQDAVAGGGRYDRLYEELGGKAVPCTGFSIGIERLIMALESNKPSLTEQVQKKIIFVAPVGNAADQEAESIWERVRETLISLKAFGFRAFQGTFSPNMADHLSRANKKGAAVVIFIGTEEVKTKTFRLRMRGSDGKTIERATKPGEKLIPILREHLRGSEML